ncbi:MAG: phenylalanine--tRNA ligase subunit beta [Gammaproteobacteria bacterium]|nr:MAG: phenylalanine--tRNA ligase subunit beta [Gammaproteobacteria bacterium]
MKFSERWLREWIDPPVDTGTLAEQLTSLGLEVDTVRQLGGEIEGVVVAEVLSVEPHPDADRLRVCRVDAGAGGEPLQIVCGAPNVRAGMKTVLATVGGTLPGFGRLRKARLRGVDSFGMLCSAKELGTSEESDGLLELAADAPVGTSIVEYLELDDAIIDIDLTPDRADCLSLIGVARDLSAKNDLPLSEHACNAIEGVIADTHPVEVSPDSCCVCFTGRVIRDLDLSGESPLWMQERLRRSGQRPINPAVDITNYVMLELGQPMHAFDLDKLQGPLQVRLAKPGETLVLLDGREVTLTSDTTVIADDRGAISIAGIMGGDSTGVDENTRNIYFEAALFLPLGIAGKPRHYAAHSESAHRFERGVDPVGQLRAQHCAAELLMSIAGGKPGPVQEWVDSARLPAREPTLLRQQRLNQVIGIAPELDTIESIMSRLGINVTAAEPVMVDGAEYRQWHVTPPSHRYDLAIEEDYIEEVARIIGFESLPRTTASVRPSFQPVDERRRPLNDIKRQLAGRGYQEVVTFSFVDAERQAILRPDLEALPLANPISADLAVMRTSLVPGLLEVMRRNQSRQRQSMKLFESGLRFLTKGDAVIDPTHGEDLQIGDGLQQQSMLAGLIVGRRAGENWNATADELDFFDLRADIEALFAEADIGATRFTGIDFDMLHPGQRAAIVLDGKTVGWFGRLNPALEARLDLDALPLVFEISQLALQLRPLMHYREISRYPSVRRDIALVVDEAVTWGELEATLREAAPETLREVQVFDIYQGEHLEAGRKSIALSLVLQDMSKTLEDADVDEVVENLVQAAASLGATLRS